MENKGYGGAPAVAMSRGKCHWRKMRAALASMLTARASGCSWLARWLKRQRGARDPVPIHPVLLRLWDTGSSAGTTAGHRGLSGLDDATFSGTGLSVCHGFADLLWHEVKWHRQRASGITMILFFSVLILFSFFFISVWQWTKIQQKKKAHPFLVPWHSYFSKFSAFCVSTIYWYDIIIQF